MAHRNGSYPVSSPCRPWWSACALAAVLSLHAAVVVAAEELDADPTAIPCTSDAPALPATVYVPADLRRLVGSMLAASATFRAQCQRIAAAPLLRVLIRIDPALVERSYRAQTSFARTRDGGIVARMAVSLRLNPVEWIAHELEHVVEQLDGLSLPALAAGNKGVWISTEKMFETTRAIHAGRAVFAEMQRARRARPWDQSSNFVE